MVRSAYVFHNNYYCRFLSARIFRSNRFKASSRLLRVKEVCRETTGLKSSGTIPSGAGVTQAIRYQLLLDAPTNYDLDFGERETPQHLPDHHGQRFFLLYGLLVPSLPASRPRSRSTAAFVRAGIVILLAFDLAAYKCRCRRPTFARSLIFSRCGVGKKGWISTTAIT